MPVRVRREILIQAQQILQEIDEYEDQLDLFQNFDQPAYQAWHDGQFSKEKQKIAELERDYAAAVQFHNSMVALAKLRRVSMPRAFEALRIEQTAYANGSVAQRQRIEEERLKREHFIRAGLNSETPQTEEVQASPALVAIEGEQLKLVYRKLVRRLHPDLQSPHTEASEIRWQKRIWNLLLLARERGDIQEIERLYKVTLLRQMDFAELTVSEAGEAHAWLTQERERLSSEAWRARQNPAWGFSRIQDLRPLAERSRQVLRAEIQQRESELSELKGQHAYLEVVSFKTPQPAARRRQTPRRNENQLSFFD